MSGPDALLLLLTAGSFAALVIAAKLPVSLSLAASSVALALAAGEGVPIDHLVEGMFSYLDVVLVLFAAMIFMKVIEANGLLAELTRSLVVLLGRSPSVLLVALTIVIMFPGMITGSCTASVLGTGVIVAPVLMRMGLPRDTTGAVVSSAAVYGMIAPPVNVPVMIIGGGIDMPYVGFGLILAVLTIVPAVLTTMWLARGKVERARLAEVVAESRAEIAASAAGGWRRGLLYLPLAVVVALMAGPRTFPGWFPDPRLPLTFLVGSALAAVAGRRVPLAAAARAGVREILPVAGILVGVGMLIEMLTLTGLRGAIVVGALSIPSAFLFASIAVILPLFGGISVYGGASVLGVPFALALLGRNQIVVLAALSLIGAMGSYLPPVAFTPVVAAGAIGGPYLRIVRRCAVPAAAAVVVGTLILIYANPVARVFGL
ncbi:MAG TPA: TRAP transporter large permease subunit [Vicinamibacterales bacterium]|nr:TRAP transporter large permease subunit [Vicinamibacterales bacterium]HPW19806.1 TRAP transporter large permease subunit [Vicinamibacterales bacterium]